MPDNFAFGRFVVQPELRQVLINGEATPVGARALDLLLALLERSHRVASKNELLQAVWPGQVVEENNLSVQVGALRRLIGADAIVTVPGRGYRFVTPLKSRAATVDAAESEAEWAASTPLTSPLPPAPEPQDPPDVTGPLIGRESDLLAVGALLDTHRLVTITGAGGAGKSRLARQLAHQRRGAFAHGVAWADIGVVAGPGRVLDTIARAVGLPGQGPNSQACLMQGLQPLQLLLVIDGAEHLGDEVANLLPSLLAAAPGLSVLVTSQMPLRLQEEHIAQLPPLAVPPGDAALEDAKACGAVRMFVESARAAGYPIQLSKDNLSGVIEICRRLDGLPLAIELAAARMPLLGVAGLATALQERMRLLTSGRRGAPPRQRSLRAALEWSHGLLDASERVVFRRLGIFSGPFTLEQACQVTADPAGDDGDIDAWCVVDALSSLVDHSLVASDREVSPQYRLLESARLLACEHLVASGEEALLQRRLAALFANDRRSGWPRRARDCVAVA